MVLSVRLTCFWRIEAIDEGSYEELDPVDRSIAKFLALPDLKTTTLASPEFVSQIIDEMDAQGTHLDGLLSEMSAIASQTIGTEDEDGPQPVEAYVRSYFQDLLKLLNQNNCHSKLHWAYVK